MQETPFRSAADASGAAGDSPKAKSGVARKAGPRDPSKSILAAPPRRFAIVPGPCMTHERLKRQSGYRADVEFRAKLPPACGHHRLFTLDRETTSVRSAASLPWRRRFGRRRKRLAA